MAILLRRRGGDQRGNDEPLVSVTMKTASKPPAKQKKEPKRVKPNKKSQAAKRKLPKRINKKKSANADGATTEGDEEPTKDTIINIINHLPLLSPTQPSILSCIKIMTTKWNRMSLPPH